MILTKCPHRNTITSNGFEPYQFHSMLVSTDISEKSHSGRMILRLGYCTLGYLDSGRLDSGRLDA